MIRSIALAGICVLGCIDTSLARSFEVDQSDNPCMPANEISKYLFDNYEEFPVMVFSSEKVKYILFASKEPKSWTLVGLVDDKIACLVNEGTQWLANKKSLEYLQK